MNSKNMTFRPYKTFLIENVIFVTPSATCFSGVWQILNGLNSPILRPVLRLFYPELPKSRAVDPSGGSWGTKKLDIALSFVVYDLSALPRARRHLPSCNPLSRLGHCQSGATRGMEEPVWGQIIFSLKETLGCRWFIWQWISSPERVIILCKSLGHRKDVSQRLRIYTQQCDTGSLGIPSRTV